MWNIDLIADSTYRAKFINLVDIISGWVEGYIKIEGKKLLDFGCGDGVTTLGMALQKNPKKIIGIEIMNDYLNCLPLAKKEIGIDELPDNIELIKVRPGEFPEKCKDFDLIYSWSVLEHVDQTSFRNILSGLKQCLRPGGLLFIQIAPLYYSAEGSHLSKWVNEPWAHLIYQDSIFKNILKNNVADVDDYDALISAYSTLNKLTGDELVNNLLDAGFEVLREYRTDDEVVIPSNLRSTFNEKVLKNNQIVLLLRAKNVD